MLFDPVNAVTNLEFYKAVAKQSIGRSFLYLAYVGLIFSLLATFALKVRIGGAVDDTFAWLETAVPPMTYAGGKLTSTAPMPMRLQSPRVPDVAVMLDTNRTDAVSPQQLDEQKVTAYVTATAIYLKESNGQLRVWPLTGQNAQQQQPVKIDADFFKSAAVVLDRVMYPVAFVIIFALFMIWKAAASLLFSVIGLLVNSLARGTMDYNGLLNVAVYAQTLVIGLQIVTLFLPFALPGATFISLAVTTLYLWLAVKRHSEPVSLPA